MRYLNDIFKKFHIDKLKPCSNMIPINNKKLKVQIIWQLIQIIKLQFIIAKTKAINLK